MWCKQCNSGGLREMFLWIFLATIAFGAPATGESSKCEKVASLAAWKDHNTIVETTVRMLAGTWISEGCETRPGPEYILRSYTFNSEGVYELIQHHYWDDSCSSPKLTILSHGRIQLRNSLVQPGASNGLTKPTNITVIPQDDKAARDLDKLVSNECPGQYWKAWKRNEEHLVFDNKQERKATYNLWSQSYQPISNRHALNNPRNLQTSGDISCLGSLKWAFQELKLVKIQFRPVLNQLRKNPRQMEMELFVGDIHSNKRRREFYSSTSFQVPLLRQTKGENITVHKHQVLIKNSNGIPTNLISNMKTTPPHLIEKPHLPPYVWGEWTSSRCESRPLDVYLMRKFSFYEEDSTWIGEHKFYSDPFCTYAKFVVTAAGRFNLVEPSSELIGSTNIDLQIEKASLTAMDQRVILEMGLQGFCGVGPWRVNVPKELSSTNGCATLGIFIPSVRFDIVKIEMDYKGSWLLYLGQADTNNLPTGADERPTAFQLPLVKCGDMPSYSHSLRDLLERKFYFHSGSGVYSPKFLTLVLLFIVSRIVR